MYRPFSLAHVSRASIHAAVRIATAAGDGDDVSDDAAEALAGDQAGSDTVGVDLPVVGPALLPDGASDGAEGGRVEDGGVRQDHGQSDSAPVGKPLAVLLAGADEVVVAEDGLHHGDDALDEGEDARAPRDVDARWVGEGLGEGPPGWYGRCLELALVVRV